MGKLSKVVAIAAVVGSVAWVGHQVVRHHREAARLHHEIAALRSAHGQSGENQSQHDVVHAGHHNMRDGDDFGLDQKSEDFGKEVQEHEDFGRHDHEEFGRRHHEDFGRHGDDTEEHDENEQDEQDENEHEQDENEQEQDENEQDENEQDENEQDEQDEDESQQPNVEDRKAKRRPGDYRHFGVRSGWRGDKLPESVSAEDVEKYYPQESKPMRHGVTSTWRGDKLPESINAEDVQKYYEPQAETQEEMPALVEVEAHVSKGQASASKEVHFREYEEEDEENDEQNDEDNDEDNDENFKGNAEWQRLKWEAKRLHCDAFRTAGNIAAGAAFVGGVHHLRRLRKEKREARAAEQAAARVGEVTYA